MESASRRLWLKLGGAISACAALGNRVWAQTYPSKPVKLIVPAIAGSAPDVIARSIGQVLAAALGQAVVIDNKPGAASNVGLDAIAKSAPDGYTIGLGTSAMATNPWLYRTVSYDPVNDFTPVNLTFAMPHALIVQADSPVKSVSDLVRMLKSDPGKYNYASGGNGSGAHLCAELFKSMSATDAVHVPFRGAPEIVTAVIGGSVLFGFPTLSTAVPLVKSGKVRALGVSGSRRNFALPEVPPIADSIPGLEFLSWFAIVGPAKMPAEVVRKMDQEILRALSDPAFREKVQADGTEVIGLGHLEFATYLRSDLQKWKRVVELSGAKVD